MSLSPQIRAPRHDQAVVAVPPLTEVKHVLADNRQRLKNSGFQLGGRPLSQLRDEAEVEIRTAAATYLRAAGEPIPVGGSGLLLAGHQPELFHPGVWVKNFALRGLATAHGLTPVNLVVDNDTLKSSSLRLPVRTNAGVGLETISFDAWDGESPYEERPVHDETLFQSFADRAGAALASWGVASMLPQFWAAVLDGAGRTPLLGERFAAARRTFERNWGCHNLEVPISRMCPTTAFGRFACHLLAELRRFHEVYNAAVHLYRRQHGIKSKSHPVPDLAGDGDWLEAPFWAWRPEQKRRGRLMARTVGERIELRVGGDLWPALPSPAADFDGAVAAWQRMEPAGYKLRSRALTTTLFARVFVADLFIHGIGGGKYDALTDDLIAQFYGLEPPGFVILSATLLLPLPTQPATLDERRRIHREVRDLRYNPERHLPPRVSLDPEVRSLLRQKADLVRAEPTDGAGRKQRFRAIRAATEQLTPLVRDQEETAEAQLVRCDHELADNAVLQRRDYAFCLFPEEKLRRFCGQFLEPAR